MNACMADGRGAAPRAAYPLLFDDGPLPAVKPVAGPARPLWLKKEDGGAGAADVPREGTAQDQHMAVLGGTAAAAEKRARKQRRLQRRQRKEEKRKVKKAKKRRKGGDA